jgi:hypothetical protein
MPSFLWQSNLPNRASKIKRLLARHDIHLHRASGHASNFSQIPHILKFDDDRWRTVSLKNQIFILCPGQQTPVLQISSNIPSILSSCSRLFAIKNIQSVRDKFG